MIPWMRSVARTPTMLEAAIGCIRHLIRQMARENPTYNNCPQPRTIEPQPCGRIIAIPHVGGFHHRYQGVA
jgi:hypothetical protein